MSYIDKKLEELPILKDRLLSKASEDSVQIIYKAMKTFALEDDLKSMGEAVKLKASEGVVDIVACKVKNIERFMDDITKSVDESRSLM